MTRARNASSPPTAAALLFVSIWLGCTTVHHTVEPYRSDIDAARHLETEAERICRDMAPARGVPEQPFVTDGCSGFPDGSKVSCCVQHDIPYWCGGSREQRRRADACLAQCVASHGAPALGRFMGGGVRITGHPRVPAGWRWGFGHVYPSGYDAPSPERPAEECPVPDPLAR
jgi:hypothetical protein